MNIHDFSPTHQARERIIEQHWSIATLKLLIILVALILIGLAFFIDNPLLLAGILAWEILP